MEAQANVPKNCVQLSCHVVHLSEEPVLHHDSFGVGHLHSTKA